VDKRVGSLPPPRRATLLAGVHRTPTKTPAIWTSKPNCSKTTKGERFGIRSLPESYAAVPEFRGAQMLMTDPGLLALVPHFLRPHRMSCCSQGRSDRGSKAQVVDPPARRQLSRC
jgi:hypothetical protein